MPQQLDPQVSTEGPISFLILVDQDLHTQRKPTWDVVHKQGRDLEGYAEEFERIGYHHGSHGSRDMIMWSDYVVTTILGVAGRSVRESIGGCTYS